MSNERRNSPEAMEPKRYGDALIWKINHLLDTIPGDRVEEGKRDYQVWISSENRVSSGHHEETRGELGTEVSFIDKPSSPEVIIDIFTDITLDEDGPVEPNMLEVNGHASIPYAGGILLRKYIIIDRASGEVASYRAVSSEIPPSWIECGSGEVLVTLDGKQEHSDVSRRDYDENLHRETIRTLNSLQL